MIRIVIIMPFCKFDSQAIAFDVIKLTAQPHLRKDPFYGGRFLLLFAVRQGILGRIAPRPSA